MNTISCNGESLTPSKIVCVGRNYVAHIHELGNEIPDDMVIFNKPNSAISPQLHAHLDEPLHYESELCFVVSGGEFCAVGFGLDLTKRGLQARLKGKGLPWERAKAFDHSVVFSAFVPLPAAPEELALRLLVDGVERQHGGVALMLYPPEVILRELANFMSLEDGDVVMTGTPAGVGQVNPGECFEGQVLCGEELLLSNSWVAT